MIYKIQRLFSKRRYEYLRRIGENFNNHYTTPSNVPGILKLGIRERYPGKNISSWGSRKDPLYGENFKKLNDELLDSEISTRVLPGGIHLEDFKGMTEGNPSNKVARNDINCNNPFVVEARRHLFDHGKTSYLYYPGMNVGDGTDMRDPRSVYATMDGLHHGYFRDLLPYGVSFRKTRNPIRISIKSEGLKTRPGTDGLEEVFEETIHPERIKVEIPVSGVGTRDRDIKRLRRYLKGHKGVVNADRDTMRALYGEKWPHIDKFPINNK